MPRRRKPNGAAKPAAALTPVEKLVLEQKNKTEQKKEDAYRRAEACHRAGLPWRLPNDGDAGGSCRPVAPKRKEREDDAESS